MTHAQVDLHRFVTRIPLPSSRLFWIAVQVPVFAVLNFIYFHRPLVDPTSINYDVRLYFDAATAVLKGQVPYRDFFFQYPPFALVFFIPPRWFAPDLAGYFSWFNVELLLLACVGVVAASNIARRVRQPVGATLLFYSVGLLSIGAILPQRYDLAPAILVLMSVAFWLDGRRGLGYALLAFGTLTKIYPVLLLPLFSWIEWRGSGMRAVARGWLIFGALIVMGMLPFLFIASQETVSAFSGQAGRGVAIASVYASVLLAARPIGVPAEIVYEQSLNTWNVEIPHADLLALGATLIQLAAIAMVYLRFMRSEGTSDAMLLRFSAAVIGLGIITGKVFAAQYIIWLFPISFLVGDKRFIAVSALFLVSALLTQLLYPFLWSDLKQGTSTAILVSLGRDVCLAALCLILLKSGPHPIPSSRVIIESNAKGEESAAL